VTVTTNDAWHCYGQPNPAFAARLSGFINGDTASGVSDSPALRTTAVTSSPEGTHLINAVLGTLSATNSPSFSLLARRR
jgi:hypothetical protein